MLRLVFNSELAFERLVLLLSLGIIANLIILGLSNRRRIFVLPGFVSVFLTLVIAMNLIYTQGQNEIFQSMIEISAKVAGLLLAVSIVGLLLHSHPLAYRIQTQSKVIVGCMQWNIVGQLGQTAFFIREFEYGDAVVSFIAAGTFLVLSNLFGAMMNKTAISENNPFLSTIALTSTILIIPLIIAFISLKWISRYNELVWLLFDPRSEDGNIKVQSGEQIIASAFAITLLVFLAAKSAIEGMDNTAIAITSLVIILYAVTPIITHFTRILYVSIPLFIFATGYFSFQPISAEWRCEGYPSMCHSGDPSLFIIGISLIFAYALWFNSMQWNDIKKIIIDDEIKAKIEEISSKWILVSTPIFLLLVVATWSYWGALSTAIVFILWILLKKGNREVAFNNTFIDIVYQQRGAGDAKIFSHHIQPFDIENFIKEREEAPEFLSKRLYMFELGSLVTLGILGLSWFLFSTEINILWSLIPFANVIFTLFIK